MAHVLLVLQTVIHVLLDQHVKQMAAVWVVTTSAVLPVQLVQHQHSTVARVHLPPFVVLANLAFIPLILSTVFLVVKVAKNAPANQHANLANVLLATI